MAKIRRVVRKVARPHGDVFDEHLWPTYVALVVLGAFSMGVSAAYLKFTDTPWYANAITWLIVIPIFVGAVMLAFRLIDNRAFRRSMQFSVVVCATLHLALVVKMIETTLFAPRERPKATAQIIEARPPKIINEYHPSQILPDEDRPRNDFERPVETETPQPQPTEEPVQREQAEDEVTPPPQPVPVPETVPTTEPNVLRRQQPSESAPRQAAQASRLSRQSKPSELKISQQLIETQTPASQQPRGATPTAAASPVQRQESSSVAVRQPTTEPTTQQEATVPQVSRRTSQDTPQPEASATPTLRRQVAQPAATPRSQIATTADPAPSRRTEPSELRPANTTAERRTTTSPEVTRTAAEPVPEVSSEPTAAPQRRQAPTENQPTVAQTPSPVPNRTPRATSRPDVATQAAVEAPAATSGQPATTAAQLTPSATSVARATAQVTAARSSATPSAEPNTAQIDTPASRITRSTAQPSPTAQANQTTPTRRRTADAPSIPQVTSPTEASPAAATTASTTGELSPASTATRRQVDVSAQAATATGQPAAAQVASSAATANSPTPIRRAETSATSNSPAIADSPNPAAASTRSNTPAVANVVTNVADVAANTGPRTASELTPGPSATSVSRQSSPTSATASRTQPAMNAQAASATAQIARGGATRAESATQPSISPTASATGLPARAIASAAVATSPTAVESPAANVAAQGAGDPTAQPARMALSKSLAGTAGSGRSPNVDRALPGGESPSLVASSAARRAEATQQAPPGDALSPSAPATIARSQAGAQAPTASLQAQQVEVATTGGGSELAAEVASASAALTRADAAARHAEITGAKGATDVDLGPTQIVSESGTGRASGGGQPELNFETQSSQIARRSDVGGSPLNSLAAAQVAEAVAAPMGTAGGQPTETEAGPTATAAVRTDAGGEAALSGGPSTAQERGPLTEPGAAALLAESSLSRADAAEGGAGSPGASGEPGLEDEEEKARRLARAARGGAPQLAIAGPTLADVPVSPMGDGGDAGAPQLNPQAEAIATSTGRQSVDGGTPRGGSPSAAGEPESGAGSPGAELVSSVTVARAEASDAPSGPAEIGGGTSAPTRSTSGPTLAASTQAEFVEVAGAPASGGVENGSPLEAQGLQAARLSGGPAGAMVEGPTGALAGPEVADASSPGIPGSGIGRREASSGEDGPSIGDVATVGAPGKRASNTEIAAGTVQLETVPETGPNSAVAQAELDHAMGNMGTAPMTRPSEGEALAVNIEAPEGPGGIGVDFTPEVGLNTRQSRADSMEVHVRSARFVRQVAGGLPAMSTAAIVSTESFSKRATRGAGSGSAGGRGSPPPQTEEAIERGLKFLARYQRDDGSWSLQSFPEEAVLVTDTGATALSLLAFQGAGYHHREHQYKDVVRNGLDYLLKNQKENGDLFVPLDNNSNRSVWLYSHSLATIAVCEAYGMTQDPELREPAQKAIDFIIAGQHAERGGWRYSPGIGADTSVTGWMMMALKSGELAGLEVPSETYQKIDKWLTLAQQSPTQPHLYRYNPYAPDTPEQRHGRTASKTMTSVGLLMRLYSGWRRDNSNFVRGADYLREHPPQIGTPREPLRDTYYWYYATQVMFHMGGEYWSEWNSKLHPLLVNSQIKQGPMAGSWDPRGPVPDRWGVQAGRLYVTTLNLLSLEVYYRHLPLYEDTAK